MHKSVVGGGVGSGSVDGGGVGVLCKCVYVICGDKFRICR